MKVALLQCDKVTENLRSRNGDYPAMFAEFLPELDFDVFSVYQDQFPGSITDYQAYLMTGSKFSVYDDIPWIHQLKTLVVEMYQKKIFFIGICFGHQMLAEALGGKVEKNNGGWAVGVHRFSVVKMQPWMKPPQSEFHLLMSCQDQVTKLPDTGKSLAISDICPTGMFQVGESMLGIQGHPEFASEYSESLMRGRLAKIGKETVERGIASLRIPPDRELISSWIQEFLAMKNG